MNETNNQQNQSGDVFAEVYKDVMELKHRSRGWSVASLVLGILSIICCCVWWIGLISGVLSIVLAVISRISLGYFDGLSIAGLITSIFGIMFGIFILIAEVAYINSPEFQQLLEEIKRIEEEEDNIDVFARIKGLFLK